MTPPPNLEEIFSQALLVPKGEARQRFLEQACAAAPDMLPRLIALLTAADDAGSFLQQSLLKEKPPVHEATFTPPVGPVSGMVEFPFLGPPIESTDLGTIGLYRILQRVGRGGMGIVFRALDPKLQRVVAIKVLAPELAADPTARKRFEREARTAAAVSHPHVVVIHAVHETHNPPYLVMEFVRGKTLAEKIAADGTLSVKEILRIGSQMAEGLAAAHKQGLIHRDIKPANILLENGVERVKVTDFGLARPADDVGMTRTGDVSGTPNFMSPEQAKGELIDHRSDLFSLGAVLYAMCTGRPPFQADSPLAAMRRICDDTPRPIQNVNPEIPGFLCKIVARLLEKSPADRIQTASEVAEMLNQRLASLQRGATGETTSSVALSKQPNRTKQPTHSVRQVIKWSILGVICLTVVATVVGLVIKLTKPAASELTLNKSIVPNLPASITAPSPLVGTVANPTLKPEPPKTTSTSWHGWPLDAPPPAIAPFGTDTAAQHQQAWAKYLDVPVELTNTLGMKFRLIPPGEFLMGSTTAEIEEAVKQAGDNPQWVDCAHSEGPQHRAIITRPFYLGVHEVTQGQFQQILKQNFSAFGATNPVVAGLDLRQHPVEQAVCMEAIEFCEKLSEIERAAERLPPGVSYTLPTEAEWEFSCRAGTTTKYWSGDREEDLLKVGWVGANSGRRTHAVGELPANPFGLHDVHGNVSEWTRDWWDARFYQRFAERPAIDEHCPVTDFRVGRGGGWELLQLHCRSSARFNYFTPHPLNWVGLRAMLTINSPKMPPRPPRPDGPAAIVNNTRWQGWSKDSPAPASGTFTAAQAVEHQQAWAKHLGIPIEFTNTLGMQFQLIPPGEFQMGTSMREFQNELPFVSLHDRDRRLSSERPKHRVTLTQTIYLGRHEVTQKQYETVMGKNPARFSKTGAGKDLVTGQETSELPVESVRAHDAIEFCLKLSELEKLKPWYEFSEGSYVRPEGDGRGYRLPTEAEWEFACRAGSQTRFWTSDREGDLPDIAWFAKNSPMRPHPVGQLKPNPFGLFDTHGNVMELCDDGFAAMIYFQSETENISIIDPLYRLNLGRQSVIRGGGFNSEPESLRSAMRNALPSDKSEPHVGFRVALTVGAILPHTE